MYNYVDKDHAVQYNAHVIQCSGVGVSSLPTFVGSVAAPHFPW